MSQAEVAKALSSTQSAIARLETAKHEPGVSLVFRYADVLGENLDLSIANWSSYSVTNISIGIRKLLIQNPPDFDMAFRLVTELITQWKRTKEDKRLDLVKQRPVTTGDKRYDAFLGGVVEQLCLDDNLESPSWVSNSEYFLDKFFWLTSIENLKAITMADTPAALSYRGVFVDASSLESV